MSTPRSLRIPSGVRTAFVDTRAGRFATLQAGPATATTTPVLLVPGWTGSKEDFLEVLEPLANDGRSALALDQRGQFETPGHDDPDAYTVTHYAHDVLDVAHAWQPEAERFHLVGHSFGGLVCRAAAIAAPDRVASLTLLCSGPGAIPANRHRMLRLMARSIAVAGLSATWRLKTRLDPAGPGPEPDPDIAAWLKKRFLSSHPYSLRSMTLHLTAEPDRTDQLAATGVPVQVAYGIDDDGWPIELQDEMAQRLGVTTAAIPEAGHSPAVDQPERTAALIVDFVTSVDDAAGKGESSR